MEGGKLTFPGRTNVIDNEVVAPQSNELVKATRTISRIVLWSFVATTGISLISVIGWVENLLIVAQLGPNYIPMAPSTALIFILLSVSCYVYYRQPSTFRHEMLAKICGFLAFVFCSTILARFLTGTTFDIEQILLYNPSFLGTTPIGKMSPVTAASFVLASVSLLLLGSSSSMRKKQSNDLAAILALVVTSIGFVMVVGYSYNAPLLYGGSTIPVALTSAIAFVFLGIGLCTSAGPASWPTRMMIGSSVHAQLLRTFLPITIIIVIIQGWFDSVLDSFMANRTLGTSTALFLALAIVVIAVSRTAKRLGGTIDRAQETIRESENRYRTVLEASMDAISVNVGTKMVYVNIRCVELLGASDPNQLVGQDFLEFVAPEDREMVKARSLGREIGEPMPALYEFTIERRDGTRIPIETHATAVEYEGRRATLSFRRDITERKKAEERFRKIFQSSPIPTTIALIEGPIVDVNDAWLRMMGFTREEVIGRSAVELGMFAEPGQRDRLVKDLLEKRRLSNIEITRRTKSGELRHGLNTFELMDLSGHTCTLSMQIDITERKQAEKEIASLARFPSENPSPIIRVRSDGLVLYANPASQQLLQKWGCRVGDVAPILVSDLIAEACAVQSPSEVEVEVDERTYLFTVIIVKGEGYVNLYGRDVTDRKRLERELKVHSQHLERLVRERTGDLEKLKLSEEKFRKIFQSSPIPSTLTLPEGPIVDVNDAWLRMMGFTRDEVVSRSGVELGIFPDPKERDQRVKDLLEKRRLSNIEITRRTKSGELRHSLNTIELIELSGQTCILTMQMDITERKRMEDELKRYSDHLGELVKERTEKLAHSEEMFRGIAESSFDLIITLDAKGHITYASPALFLMTGHIPEQVAGKVFTNYLPRDEVTKFTQVFTKIVGGELIKAQESKLLRVDGSVVDVEISASPIIGSGGAVLGVVTIIRDVTERRRLAEMRDRFVSSVTHELRTPLVSMTGYLDLVLSTHGRAPSEVESYLQVVRRNTDRLLSLTNDLLDIQRMQAGRLQLTIQPLNLHEIIIEAIKEIKPLIDGKKQKLSLKIPEGPLLVEADPIRLSQIFINLLSNASKFAPEAGELTLSTKEIGGIIQIQVSDNGIGIKREDIERIFQPFASIQKPSYIKGTGLGLSITKGLIEAHGGKIWAESKGEGKGATFTFTIPKHKKTA